MGFPSTTSSKQFRWNTNCHLSKELGAECIPCRVAWTSVTLTKAWQGAVEGEMGHISAATFQQAETAAVSTHVGLRQSSEPLWERYGVTYPKALLLCCYL